MINARITRSRAEPIVVCIFQDIQTKNGRIIFQIIFLQIGSKETVLELLIIWCKSYLSNCSQYASINGCKFGLAAISCHVPQKSVPDYLLFLLFINKVNQAITLLLTLIY